MRLVNRRINKLSRKEIPQTFGVYLFSDPSKTPLYIGKANNLKQRLSFYFNILDGKGKSKNDFFNKTLKMLNDSVYLSLLLVNSEIEAILLEAKLIKKYQPKYNFIAKDDKHPLYIKITNEKYPSVITVRKIDDTHDAKAVFGPFPSSANVNMVLKMIRKIFPFSNHRLSPGKACIYNEIGLCNPCPNTIEVQTNEQNKNELSKRYRSNITKIKKFLSGDMDKLKVILYREITQLSEKQEFEKAGYVKKQLESVNYITQPISSPSSFLQNPMLRSEMFDAESRELVEILSPYYDLKKMERVECFDIAHLHGSFATASMVAFCKGEPLKQYYRHFRIRQKRGMDDIASMKEVVRRRARHFDDWGIPDLVIVDGGKAQVGAFREIFTFHGIPLIGLAKKEETLIIPVYSSGLEYKQYKLKRGPARNFVQRVRDEAHRFARRYHHLLVKKALLK